MRHGNLSVATRVFLDAISLLHSKFCFLDLTSTYSFSILEVVERAVLSVSPPVQLKRVRFGAITILIPVAVNEHKSCSLGISWIVDSARLHTGLPHNRLLSKFSFHLANELFDAFLSKGSSHNKKVAYLKSGFYNMAYVHYSW